MNILQLERVNIGVFCSLSNREFSSLESSTDTCVLSPEISRQGTSC